MILNKFSVHRRTPEVKKPSGYYQVGMPELTESELAFIIKSLMDEPKKKAHLENSILNKFIRIWACYILRQGQRQVFKMASLLKMCLTLFYVTAFSKTVIMPINRVSDLPRWVTKWLEDGSQQILIRVSLRPGGRWTQAILGLDLFSVFSHNLDEDIRDAFLKPAEAAKLRGRGNSSLILAVSPNHLDLPFPHL